MTFSKFSNWLQKLEEIKSRNQITELIAQMLGELDLEETPMALYLLQGQLYPTYKSLEFNFSGKLLIKSLKTIGSAETDVSKIYAQKGDVGLTAEEVIETLRTNADNNLTLLQEEIPKVQDLSITQVYKSLVDLATLSGKGSQEQKIENYKDLILVLDSLSVRYATRIIVGQLRLGVSDKTILDSLSWFKTQDKSLRKKLDRAYGSRSDIGELAVTVKISTNLEKDLESIMVEPGVPLASKLVEREASAQKVWDRMPNCFVQPKLDGLRGQIHLSKTGEVNIFSRNMENMTDQFPEIINAVRNLGVESIILDSEIVGITAQNDTSPHVYLTYQETMQRKRKFDIEEFSKSVPVVAMCFDVMFLNGKDLTHEPIETRIKELQALTKNSDTLRMLETIQTSSSEELQNYFQTQTKLGLEGIITKAVNSIYEPGTRNYQWIKLKANTQTELVDTIDVMVLGYYHGRGQRAKFGIGALLTGVYDEKTDKFYSIGKVGSGITEEVLAEVAKDLQAITIPEKPENVVVDSTLHPDVWVEPKIVVEIVADEITRSPNHTAAKGVKTSVPKDNPERGLSIRFPRLKIWNRDKNLPNSVNEIVKMYELRKGISK